MFLGELAKPANRQKLNRNLFVFWRGVSSNKHPSTAALLVSMRGHPSISSLSATVNVLVGRY